MSGQGRRMWGQINYSMLCECTKAAMKKNYKLDALKEHEMSQNSGSP